MQNPWERLARVYRHEGISGILLLPLRSYRRRAWNEAQAHIQDVARQELSAKRKFEIIYERGLWAKASPTLRPARSLSGQGSTEVSTRVLRYQLEQFLRDENIQTFFDAPCGDFGWMPLVQFPSGCGYIGGDIVDFIVESLSANMGYEPGDRARTPLFRRFICCDLRESKLPKADAWLCKDCIQHLSIADIKSVLRNFASSEIRTALISNHEGVFENRDIPTGDFRHVDLTKPPFNLPAPRLILSDKPVDGEPRYIAVWDRSAVIESIRRMT